MDQLIFLKILKIIIMIDTYLQKYIVMLLKQEVVHHDFLRGILHRKLLRCEGSFVVQNVGAWVVF